MHILNLLPSKAIKNETPFTKLFKKQTIYTHLRVFGCLCYPNQNLAHNKKLSPRSSRCILLGYPHNHRCYRCFDLTTKKIIIPRHVNFDETCFPYQQNSDKETQTYNFLDQETEPSPIFRGILQNTSSHPPAPAVIPTETQQPTQVVTTAVPRHQMATRSKSGITKPRQQLSLHTQKFSPLPKSYLRALGIRRWMLSTMR